MVNEFEVEIAKFIDGNDYDECERKILALMRTVFKAGWVAAGGTPPEYSEPEGIGQE